MAPVPPRRRRARPVADAPIDALLPRSEELAKGWLLALLEQAPLDDAPAILAADLTRDGPRVCDAVLRAVFDDADLRRLEPGGVLEPLAARVGEMAGAASPVAICSAVDALQGVIWSAVRDELRGADADLVSELTERLTLISQLVRSAALGRAVSEGRSGRGAATPPPPPVAQTRPPAPRAAPTRTAAAPTRTPAPPAAERTWPGVSDGRRESAPSLWVGALQDEIVRSVGTPLSLLLAELEDAERVAAVEPSPEARATFGRFTAAIRNAVRREDILVCESDSRAWIIARDTDRAGARALGERIAAAVTEAASWRGAPLVASVGVAVLGDDGRTSGELIAAAEEARFAATASGAAVWRGDES